MCASYDVIEGINNKLTSSLPTNQKICIINCYNRVFFVSLFIDMLSVLSGFLMQIMKLLMYGMVVLSSDQNINCFMRYAYPFLQLEQPLQYFVGILNMFDKLYFSFVVVHLFLYCQYQLNCRLIFNQNNIACLFIPKVNLLIYSISFFHVYFAWKINLKTEGFREFRHCH